MNASAMPARNLTRWEGQKRRTEGTLFLWKPDSGSADLVRHLQRSMLHALGPALSHQQKPDAFQQVDRRVHSLGEENVRLRVMIVDADLARDQDGWRVRRHILDLRDQLRPVESRHRHVGNYQIDSALQEARQSIFAAGETRDAIAAGFEHDFAVRERLFVIVYTQNRALRFHPSSAVCRPPPQQRWRNQQRLFSI